MSPTDLVFLLLQIGSAFSSQASSPPSSCVACHDVGEGHYIKVSSHVYLNDTVCTSLYLMPPPPSHATAAAGGGGVSGSPSFPATDDLTPNCTACNPDGLRFYPNTVSWRNDDGSVCYNATFARKVLTIVSSSTN